MMENFWKAPLEWGLASTSCEVKLKTLKYEDVVKIGNKIICFLHKTATCESDPVQPTKLKNVD